MANTPSRLPAPSTGLLSLLAAVASANGAHGSPTPPSFLCPGLGSDECATSSTAPITLHRKRSSSSKRKVDRKIPDKYEEGEDGVWRKVDYSLHGGGVRPRARYRPALEKSYTPHRAVLRLQAHISTTTRSFPYHPHHPLQHLPRPQQHHRPTWQRHQPISWRPYLMAGSQPHARLRAGRLSSSRYPLLSPSASASS